MYKKQVRLSTEPQDSTEVLKRLTAGFVGVAVMGVHSQDPGHHPSPPYPSPWHIEAAAPTTSGTTTYTPQATISKAWGS